MAEPTKGWAQTVWAMLHEGDDAIPVLVFETVADRNDALRRLSQPCLDCRRSGGGHCVWCGKPGGE